MSAKERVSMGGVVPVWFVGEKEFCVTDKLTSIDLYNPILRHLPNPLYYYESML